MARTARGSVINMMKPPATDLDGLLRLRSELIADGLTDNQIARLVRAKVLHRVRHGAYVPHASWSALTPEDRHRLLSRAVLRTAHESTALTHTSSLVERGIPLWGLPLDVAHTTQRVRRKAGRRVDDWIPHRGRLLEEEVEELNGVSVSIAPRSAVEICSIASVEPALIAVNGLLRAKAMSLAEFAEQAALCRLWPGSLTTDIVLRLADPRLESIGEDRFAYLCYLQSLPKPEPQVEIADDNGEVFARVDFAWPEYGVFVEFDGKIKYDRYRRDGETLDEFLMREKEREELICQLTGWTCIRITWAQLAQPQLLSARIRKLLASRSPKVG
jgi:hypothetical protein